MLKRAQTSDLPKIVDCHVAAFPENLHTKLGKSFVTKTFVPFTTDGDKYLMFIEEGEICVGFFSALPVGGEFGSASTMIQSAFSQGILALLARPQLLLHPEVRKKLPLIRRNVKTKMLKSLGKKPANRNRTASKNEGRVLGLAGMGVHPDHRNGGYAIELVRGVEELARQLGYEAVLGSVNVKNDSANALYRLLGWSLTPKSETVYTVTKRVQGAESKRRQPAGLKHDEAENSPSSFVFESTKRCRAS